MEHAGGLIRHWRTKRRMSQQQLAHDAEVSARHLSCVETGKARPSREMVLVLSSALDIPLRERNAVLQAAGHAPAYRETDLDDPRMAPIKAALTFLLRQSEPYGAVVVDRLWNVVMMNGALERLSTTMMGEVARPRNLLRFTFTALRPYIENFDEVAASTLHRVRREAVQTGDDELHALYEELAAHVPHLEGRDDWDDHPSLLLPVRFAKGPVHLDFFTTLTTLGTPQDVTLSELRIESYFPATPATDTLVRAMVGPPTS
jgi:transcriptional regulator with XRE-family HTH domain